ncbi:DedA family protein [Saccharolobus solfataricus]|uniref:Membrane protein, putative n=2 Tax=Saccharolobus solfataricus TaxID=2287 RepID=Q97V45_SACS2|nr:DedA family protein [Saccharolobus solfataricus]AAK42900.1 Membrane protein, putative [Saccharolobus solfataricus P2]QPG49987.1 DedA family protein [Saccharolobus solfataricus]
MVYVFQGIGGYIILFLLMIGEGIGLPLPSEVIMPLVGYYSYLGSISLYLGVIVGTLGSLVGSIIAYIIGYKLGLAFLKRYGKYILIDEGKIEALHNWFLRYGNMAVFGFRFIPGLRALISYPAGIGQMKILKFLGFTFLGHTIWDIVLALIGYQLANQINFVITQAEKLGNYLFILVIVIIVIYILWRIFWKRK